MKLMPWEDETIAANGRKVKENFADWFGQSKVIDERGMPLITYHGTAEDFNAFDNAKTGKNDRGLWGRGHYFSTASTSADSYALRQGDGARIILTYVSIQSPLILKTGADLVTRLPDGTNCKDLLGPNLDGSKIKRIAQSLGHDGVIQIKPNGSIGDLVAFESTQIKSATGNAGLFIKGNPSLDDQECAKRLLLARDATNAARGPSVARGAQP